jgi:hypothetical protein
MEPWCLICGAWGDSLAAYGNMCRYLKENNIPKANVVYFGLDANICEFLKFQPNVNKVSFLKISDPKEIYIYQHKASHHFKEWMEITGIDKEIPNLLPTHVNKHHLKDDPTDCYRDFHCVLPPMLGNWDEFLAPLKPYILVQPFSIQSCTFNHHWPHWVPAIEWMAENTDRNIVMVGQLFSEADPEYKFPWIEHPRIINLVGQTQNMPEVLHIANQAERIVSTANGLSLWSIINDKPALVMCHLLIKMLAPYYYNWIHGGRNSVFDHEASLDDFKKAFLDPSSLIGLGEVESGAIQHS